jgi:hypothetical protein
MPARAYVPGFALAEHAWARWLTTQATAAKTRITIYVHRLAAVPSRSDSPLCPVYAALTAAAARGVRCRLIAPVNDPPRASSTLNHSAVLHFASKGWQIHYLTMLPTPACRLYLFDTSACAWSTHDLLGSHLLAPHLYSLILTGTDEVALTADTLSLYWQRAHPCVD